MATVIKKPNPNTVLGKVTDTNGRPWMLLILLYLKDSLKLELLKVEIPFMQCAMEREI
ncbi:MAG TPA: hypothetical protein PKD24_04325 [Pyrinomonadaceae bacterium]|nr:hypothetical protein [Pyrinomonadaceae bacterium]